MTHKLLKLTALFLPPILLLGCETNPSTPSTNQPVDSVGIQSSGISFGLIKRELVVGKSTQEDVLRRFGSPNNMVFTSGGKGEMWIYDRINSESKTDSIASSSGVAIGVSGGSALIGAGGRSSSGTSSTSTSVRTLTVILDFNAKGVLTDISARQGGY
jgi:hypothetical protein